MARQYVGRLEIRDPATGEPIATGHADLIQIEDGWQGSVRFDESVRFDSRWNQDFCVRLPSEQTGIAHLAVSVGPGGEDGSLWFHRIDVIGTGEVPF